MKNYTRGNYYVSPRIKKDKKLVITCDEDFLLKVKTLSEELKLDNSKFIRLIVEKYYQETRLNPELDRILEERINNLNKSHDNDTI